MVRCTKPVEYVFPQFTNDPAKSWRRPPEHQQQFPNYPDPDHFLGPTQKYLFRAPELRHMRIGQVVRYFAGAKAVGAGAEEDAAKDTAENTCNQDRYRPREAEDAEESHRHYDSYAASLRPGCWVQHPEHWSTRLTRRKNTALGVPRSGASVPLGGSREPFYEKRLLEGLAWHCKAGPESVPNEGRRRRKRWCFHCELPQGCRLPAEERAALNFSMVDRELEGKPSFEVFCRSIERSFADAGLVCQCCAEVFGDPCPTCTHAQGFHLCEFVDPPSSSEASDDAPAPAAGQATGKTDGECEKHDTELRWKAGTLHNGKVDITAALLNLAKRHVPTAELEALLDTAIDEGHMELEEVDEYRETFEQIAGVVREVDVFQAPGQAPAQAPTSRGMTMDEMRADLARREELLRALCTPSLPW